MVDEAATAAGVVAVVAARSFKRARKMSSITVSLCSIALTVARLACVVVVLLLEPEDVLAAAMDDVVVAVV